MSAARPEPGEAVRTAMAGAVSEAKQRLAALVRPDSLVLPLFSDLHAPALTDGSVRVLTALLAEITAEIPCDAVFDLGDNADMLGRTRHIANGDLSAFFTDLLGQIAASCACPLFCVPGNHDAPGTEFFDAAFWNAVVRGRFGHADAVYGAECAYWYADFGRAHTRAIVLSVPCASDTASEHPKPVWRFGEEQLLWLERALRTERHVLLFVHAPFFSEYRGNPAAELGVWTGESAAVSLIADLCGRIEEAEQAAAVLDRFAARTGRLWACFSGHTHADALLLPRETKNGYFNPLPCPQAVTRAFSGRLCRAPADAGNAFGFALDILVWTPSAPRLDLVRIGDGADRRIL